MTVLRSREIVSTVNSTGSLSKALENGVSEPVTPVKTIEISNKSLINTTPSSSSSAPNPGVESRSLGGSNVGSEAVLVRRSARLAAKLGTGDHLENIEIMSGKRKKVETKVENNSSQGVCEIGYLEKVVLDSDLEAEKEGRFLEQTMMGTWLLRNSGNGGASGSVPDLEEVKFDRGVEDPGFGCDGETLGVETANNGKGERAYSTEMGLSVSKSDKKDGGEKRFFNLRSGKKVVKRTIDSDFRGPSIGLEGVESSDNDAKSGCGKESEILLNGDNVTTDSERNMEEDVYGSWRKRRLSGGENGKGKVVGKTFLTSSAVSVKLEVGKEVGLIIDDSCSDLSRSRGIADGKVEVTDQSVIRIETGVKTRGRLRKEEKGKGKLVDKDSSYNGMDALDQRFELRVEDRNENALAGTIHLPENAALVDVNVIGETDTRSYKKRFRDIARQNASRFAHFSAQEEEQSLAAAGNAGREIASSEAVSETEDWPGPFSTAMKIIKDREMNVKGLHGSSVDKSKAVELRWVPRKDEQCNRQKQFLPSLQQLCLSVLAKNADAITSLDCIPDVLRHKLCQLLCDSRKMNNHFLQLLVSGFPTEIRLRDCSWLSEELFTRTFESTDTSNLTVLQLDQCGCCVPDYALSATLARSHNSLPALTTVSLKGAYRLSDAGLSALVSSAPSITSINLTQCSLLTSDGICSLIKSLRSVLRELYIDDCLEIDAMLILPAMLKLEHLEVLSLGGIQTVCDNFISEIVSVHGYRIKELGLAGCMQLSDLSLKVIAATCSELRVIDLMNLCKLTDTAMAHLANGCQAIHTLKLCRNPFSDEAIAAYLEISGASLIELSLNNINKVSNNTALSLAGHSRNLVTLDLSWCRNLTNEALGLIVDSCSSLEVLKLFGCTQVTDVFLDGHSNPQVKVIGLKMGQVFEHIKEPDFL
ncbi:Leucine-rich repeat [Forsythia ovata]|uniref:Leucine-rich repeat n=1 Tax=Forsythia ovata TaxID=205694 RepID=A0ABD1WWE7_9LAMI